MQTYNTYFFFLKKALSTLKITASPLFFFFFFTFYTFTSDDFNQGISQDSRDIKYLKYKISKRNNTSIEQQSISISFYHWEHLTNKNKEILLNKVSQRIILLCLKMMTNREKPKFAWQWVL